VTRCLKRSRTGCGTPPARWPRALKLIRANGSAVRQTRVR
jgi:hypothetical protein